MQVDQVVINFCLNDIYNQSTKGIRAGSKNVFGRVLNFLKSNSYLYIWLKHKISDRNKAYYLYDSEFYHQQESLDYIEQTLTEINLICKNKSIDLSIVIFPYEYQLRSNDRELFFPQKNLSNIFQSVDIPFFDAEEFLISFSKNSKELYLYGDGIHFSNKGHEQVFQYFLDKNIIEF